MITPIDRKSVSVQRRIKEQANISESLLELCRAKGTKSVKWLTNNEESDTFVNKWRMYGARTNMKNFA